MQVVLAGMGFERRARDVQQRPPQLAGAEIAVFAHCRQALHAGAAQGAQQEGLGLVVAVMRQRQAFARAQDSGERRMAGAARGRLGAFAGVRVHLHPHHLQRHLPSPADVLAVRGPGVGGGLQPVVHMHRAQAACAHRRGMREKVQQHGRIQAAAEADQHRRGGVRQRWQARFHRRHCRRGVSHAGTGGRGASSLAGAQGR